MPQKDALMPELPEVETMVRGIRPAMQGSKLVELRACPCTKKPLSVTPALEEFTQRVRGQKVEAVERKAKRIVIRLKEDVIVFEPRMTGLALLTDPPSLEHLRFEFCLTRGKQKQSVWIWDRRGLGTLRLMSHQEFDVALGENVLGPDALEISVDELLARLKETKRAIKVALLDQKLIAGVGNLYASEILHEAKISPVAEASKLSRQRVDRIHKAMNRILREAIQYEGSTLNDGTYRNALNQNGSYQNKHCVYAKEGEPCKTCETSSIRRIVQAQRSTFYCPKCQKR